jgi:23S rRNA (uracil1939-C5)-methyltransferase
MAYRDFKTGRHLQAGRGASVLHAATQPPPSASFELVPQKLVYGGAALGHHEGRPVLVAGAVPGERVEVEAVRQAKGMVYARILKVLAPSPERIAAPCPYFGRCGGCHYQHLGAARQLETKREILRETLRRIGGIDWQGEIGLHAADPWRYRNQAQFKLSPGPEGKTVIGYFGTDSHRLVPIDVCPILSPRLNAILAEISRAEWASRLTGFAEVDLFADDRDEETMLTLRGSHADRESLAQDCLSLLPGVTSVAFEPYGSAPSSARTNARSNAPYRTSAGSLRVFGKPRIRYQVRDCTYEVSPSSFFQASRFLLPDLVAAVVDGFNGGLALDLYAGVGLFTLPLAQRFKQVIAVEANPSAAADLERNIHAAGFTNARTVRAKTSDFLRRYAQGAPDLAVLDPPRAGSDAETIRLLSKLGPGHICYVSCQPPTLARDLAMLLRHGYRLESVELFDLFPQTFHIESVARLTRS